MIQIYITEEVWQWLKAESADDGIGFKDVKPDPIEDAGMIEDGYLHVIEISEEISDRLIKDFETKLDCSFDEPCFMYNTALELLKDDSDKPTLN